MYKSFLYTALYITFFTANLYGSSQVPIAKEGVLDLREWDFYKDGNTKLQGEWEFYWEKLYSPKDFKKGVNDHHFIQVPKSWKGEQINEKKINQFGFATYRLSILLPEDAPSDFSFAVTYIPTACKIFVNGTLISDHGIVGKSRKESDPGFINEVIDFSVGTDTIELIIQVSNYKFYKAGLAYDINFGEISKTNRQRTTQFGIELFLIGALFIMSIFFLSYYLFRPVYMATLYFGLFCLAAFIYSFFVGLPHLMLFENLSFKFQTNIIRYTAYLFPFLLIKYFQCTFPKEVHRFAIWVFGYPSILLVVISIFLPIHLSSPLMIYYRYIIYFAMLYMTYAVILANIRKRQGAKIILVGFILLFAFILNDVLYHAELIKTQNLMPIGLLLFIVSMSYYLSAQFAFAFKNKAKLANELNILNENQEQIIQERTMEITMQKEEIRKQADKLQETNSRLIENDVFKEGLTGMIVHDLKNPLNIICNAPDLIQTGDDIKIIKKAGEQMLNLVSNILDVQKYENSIMELNLSEICIFECVHNAIDQTINTYGNKNHQISNNINKAFYVNADHEILDRIFINLLTNAVKFTPSGGNITVDAVKEKDMIKIMVKDTGIGISTEMKSLIFDKFAQVIAKKTGKSRSTGLGLTFCKIAVEAHKGKIWAESKSNEGATFCFTLPLAG